MTASSTEIPSLGLCGQVMSAVEETATVMEQREIAHQTYHMRLHCPEIARQIHPGQFFMLRSPQLSDPLLGRPFALLDVVRDSSGTAIGLDFGYVAVGKFTRQLTALVRGSTLSMWGPLGNGFPTVSGGHLAIVAGGIGQTPFVAVIREALGLVTYGEHPRAQQRPSKITVCYGARTQTLLAGLQWFELPGVDLRISTDDGSAGQRGYVTGLLQELLDSEQPPTQVFCCGPEPMMRAVAKLTVARNVPAWLSLETPMACGIGACFSCVARIRQPDGDWDYRRTCVEGPVFPAADVVFSDEH